MYLQNLSPRAKLARLFALALTLPAASFAAVDTSSATTAISDAQTGILAVVAALTLFAGAVWAAMRIYKLLSRG